MRSESSASSATSAAARSATGSPPARAAAGVATRAVRLLGGLDLRGLPVDRIGIAAERDNAGSCAVAERAGFRFEGVLRSWLVIKGSPAGHRHVLAAARRARAA